MEQYNQENHLNIEFDEQEYSEEQESRYAPWTEEEDRILTERYNHGKENNIKLNIVFLQVSQLIDRTPSALSNRAHILKLNQSKRSFTIEDDDTLEMPDTSMILEELKKVDRILRERNYFKNKYEESLRKLTDYDQIKKDYEKIKRMFK